MPEQEPYQKPRICREGGSGLILPLGGDWELELHDGFRAFLYFIALAWSFLGVAIVADIFMSAIETITSKKTRIWDEGKGRYRTVKIWNDTVANLTLMALGSSAPEILLSVIELLKEEFYSGDLGPGTIVGSAAFNLLGITAVCVASIPSPGVRYIKDVSVYSVTAIFSLFAYMWLLIILLGPTPDRVTVEEAILTFLFFPVLVTIAFMADKGYLCGMPTTTKQTVVAAEMTKEELGALIREIKDEFGDVDDSQMTVLIEKKTAAQASKARYRAMMATAKSLRFTTCKGPPATVGVFQSHPGDECDSDNGDMCEPGNMALIDVKSSRSCSKDGAQDNDICWVSFPSSNFAVCESTGCLSVSVKRSGNKHTRFNVRYRTQEGTAKAGTDYVHVEGLLEFMPGVMSRDITVAILDDTEWESAEDFYIELSDPQVLPDGDASVATSPINRGQMQPGGAGSAVAGAGLKIECTEEPNRVQVAPIGTATVTIIDDDDPGTLAFATNLFTLEEKDNDSYEKVEVVRRKGSRGRITVSYRTENGSAVAPLDFDEATGTLEFLDGQISASIDLVIKARGRYESTESFRLVMFDPVGCRFDNEGDGDESEQTMWIEIRANTDYRSAVDKLSKTLALNWDKARIGKTKWIDQFIEAIFVGGSPEEQAEAGVLDWSFHVISLPWKLIFSLVPPPDLGGGWSCFFMALVGIGALTALVGDLASLLGCCLQMPDMITAITFVALGTSLPDTFASKSAAQCDPYADASVGNITGSNSVNVFLGLGMPWTLGALYWSIRGPTEEWKLRYPDMVDRYPQGGFIVVAKGLDFSVAIFVTCALTCMVCLYIRRRLFGGELGGPEIPKVASSVFLVLLWIGYVGTSWAYYIITNE